MGKDCVVKWFPERGSSNFKREQEASHFASNVIRMWNDMRPNMKILMNPMGVWEFIDHSLNQKGHSAMIELFLKNFRHWNSNSGWADNKSSWGKIMQALSHFSYHASNGKNLLCDLQGNLSRNGPVITNPAVCSRTEQYGISDLGTVGIRNFFAHHKCNEYCSPNWIKPRTYVKSFKPKKSTTSWDAAKGCHVCRFF